MFLTIRLLDFLKNLHPDKFEDLDISLSRARKYSYRTFIQFGYDEAPIEYDLYFEIRYVISDHRYIFYSRSLSHKNLHNIDKLLDYNLSEYSDEELLLLFGKNYMDDNLYSNPDKIKEILVELTSDLGYSDLKFNPTFKE